MILKAILNSTLVYFECVREAEMRESKKVEAEAARKKRKEERELKKEKKKMEADPTKKWRKKFLRRRFNRDFELGFIITSFFLDKNVFVFSDSCN